jgi:hypothetical protein
MARDKEVTSTANISYCYIHLTPFSRFGAREREKKKSAGARRKISAKKSENLPLPHHTVNPVPEFKSTLPREKQGSCMYQLRGKDTAED